MKLREKKITDYNVVWNKPSKDKTGQMPIGNGDIGAGVYVIENGDLYLLLSKNDAYTYCGDLFKTGLLHIKIKPSPFQKGMKFQQTLNMGTGSIDIVANKIKIKVWADMYENIYHIEITSEEPIEVEAKPIFWERFDRMGCNILDEREKEISNGQKPVQDVCVARDDSLIWYYHVGHRSIYESDLRYYDIPYMSEHFEDPFQYNTFGNLLICDEMQRNEQKLLGKHTYFDIRAYALTKKCKNVAKFVETITELSQGNRETKDAWNNHIKWWQGFWEKSYIDISDNRVAEEKRGVLFGEHLNGERVEEDTGSLVSQNYTVYRFLMACQSRGKVPTKFNGGIFTQPLRCEKLPAHCKPVFLEDGSYVTHEDERPWGRRFTFQNQRLMYWPLLKSGDTELMRVFFSYYVDMLKIRKAITKEWFGHEGAYYRENIEPTGAERDCSEDGKPLKTPPGKNDGSGYYHSYYFTSSLELTSMMIHYVKYTNDLVFLEKSLLPVAREVMLFFDQHYGRDKNGKLKLDPAMVLETWWVAINPAPDIAGLRYCISQLLEMGVGTRKDQNYWKSLLNCIPEIEMGDSGGKKYILPAKEYSVCKNSENGELYPVFPFQLYGVGHGTEDIVANTMERRAMKDKYECRCWTQDQIHWAYAGNGEEAAKGLIKRFRAASTECRFPLYGRANPDSCPDFDHFGSGSIALQSMLVQETNDKIILLPAWPSYWDVKFKLCLENGAMVKGTVRNGELENYEIINNKHNKEVLIYKCC